MRKHLVIPDTQVKPGISLDYLEWVGRYIVHKKPDVIVQIGDFNDMESLSSYDVGKKSFEGRRYKADIEVGNAAMGRLMGPMIEYNEKARREKKKLYTPRRVLTLGNHEHRIIRATEDDPKLDGTLDIKDLNYETWGWEVYPFLQVVEIDGVAYSHYFPSGQMGRPCTSARAILTKHHQSAFAGHQQGRDIAYGKRADGKAITTIIAGSYYEHDEPYLNPFTNRHWRGVYMLHEVNDGEFDEMAVSLNYLKRKYGEAK
jgi:hypothetical protein